MTAINSFLPGATMVLSLRPEIQQFIDEQVKAGYFPSPEAVVEAAILEMQVESGDEVQMDAETSAAIKRGRNQLDRGEGIEFASVRAHWKKRLRGA
jgi:Arc/MetJ-type ribon-helix-helix transcriptional regulator